MGNDQQNNKHQGDENTRPSVGKDQPQDLQAGMPPAAPGSTRGASSNPPPANTPNPDPGYAQQKPTSDQSHKNAGQQQNQGQKPGQQDESTRKAEIRKAVEEDMPGGQGSEKTQFSGGT